MCVSAKFLEGQFTSLLGGASASSGRPGNSFDVQGEGLWKVAVKKYHFLPGNSNVAVEGSIARFPQACRNIVKQIWVWNKGISIPSGCCHRCPGVALGCDGSNIGSGVNPITKFTASLIPCKGVRRDLNCQPFGAPRVVSYRLPIVARRLPRLQCRA